jgi:hypothetical protein
MWIEGRKKKTIFYEYNNYPLGCVFIRIFLKGLLGVFRRKNWSYYWKIGIRNMNLSLF